MDIAGIGAAITERLAADGFAVLINISGNTAAEALRRKIESAGGRAAQAQADVSSSAAVAAMSDAGFLLYSLSYCLPQRPYACQPRRARRRGALPEPPFRAPSARVGSVPLSPRCRA